MVGVGGRDAVLTILFRSSICWRLLSWLKSWQHAIR